MKQTVTVTPKVAENIYPYIGVAENGYVVLFKRENCGTALTCPIGGIEPVGEYSETWEEKRYFKPIKSITIEQTEG